MEIRQEIPQELPRADFLRGQGFILAGTRVGTREVSIFGLNKADVLMALYNNAKGSDGIDMTREDANKQVERNRELRFNFIGNRTVKTDIHADTIITKFYDFHNGEAAALHAIRSLPHPAISCIYSLRHSRGLPTRDTPDYLMPESRERSINDVSRSG